MKLTCARCGELVDVPRTVDAADLQRRLDEGDPSAETDVYEIRQRMGRRCQFDKSGSHRKPRGDA